MIFFRSFGAVKVNTELTKLIKNINYPLDK